jgi:energy-coupling factor transport system substrate-specific component
MKLICIFFIILAAAALGAAVYYKRKNGILLQKQEDYKLLTKQIIAAFAKTIDCKDSYTKGHSFRVAWYTSLLAEKLGCSEDRIEQYYDIALLHDIGKMGISDSILTKPTRLTDEEFSVIKNHPEKGYEILSDISMFPDLATGARYHHEQIDGGGYPLGLKDTEIPLVARIIAVADTFDAMASSRAYRKRLSTEAIISELKRVKGKQLDSKIVDFMLQIIDEVNLSDMEPFEEYYR